MRHGLPARHEKRTRRFGAVVATACLAVALHACIAEEGTGESSARQEENNPGVLAGGKHLAFEASGGGYVVQESMPEVLDLWGMAQQPPSVEDVMNSYPDAERGAAALPYVPQVFPLEEFERESTDRAEELRPVPASAALPGSRNYAILHQSQYPVCFGSGSGATSRVYSESSFGGILLVQECKASRAPRIKANLEIAGHPAAISVAGHSENFWCTAVIGYDGEKAHKIEVGVRLEGDERERFVALAREIIEGN